MAANDNYCGWWRFRNSLSSSSIAVGSLDIALTAKAQQIAERRLNLLCTSFQRDMQRVENDVIDKEYLDSEECIDLVLRAWEATKRTRSDEKIRLYARVLSGAIQLQDRNENSPEDYLAVLDELSPKELEVARALFTQQKSQPASDENELQWLRRIGVLWSEDEKRQRKDEKKANGQRGEHPKNGDGQWHKLLIDCPTISEDEIESILLRLQRSGLVSELSGSYLGYSGGTYVITRTFRKLITYIDKNNITSGIQ